MLHKVTHLHTWQRRNNNKVKGRKTSKKKRTGRQKKNIRESKKISSKRAKQKKTHTLTHLAKINNIKARKHTKKTEQEKEEK